MQISRILAATGLVVLVGAAAVAKRPGVPTDLTCMTPVKPTDSAASLVERFGSAARIESYDKFNSKWQVVILFPDNPKFRLEISFWDDQPGQRMTHVSRVLALSPAHWRLAGVGSGDDWQKIAQVNGRPFQFQGYGNPDGGGAVDSMSGGTLAQLPGGCMPFFWLTRPSSASMPSRLLEPASLMSNDPALRNQHLKIHGVGYMVPMPRQK